MGAWVRKLSWVVMMWTPVWPVAGSTCAYCGGDDSGVHHCGRDSGGGGYDTVYQQIEDSRRFNEQMNQQSQQIIENIGRKMDEIFSNDTGSGGGGYSGYDYGNTGGYVSPGVSPAYQAALAEAQRAEQARFEEAKRQAEQAAALLAEAKKQADGVQRQALLDLASSLLDASMNTMSGMGPMGSGSDPMGAGNPQQSGLSDPWIEPASEALGGLPPDMEGLMMPRFALAGEGGDEAGERMLNGVRLESLSRLERELLARELAKTLPEELEAESNPWNWKAWDNRELIARQEERLTDSRGRQSELDEWGEGLRERERRAEEALQRGRITRTEYHDRMSGISDEKARWVEQTRTQKGREAYAEWQLQRLRGESDDTTPPRQDDPYLSPAEYRERSEEHDAAAHRTGLEDRQNRLDQMKEQDRITASEAARIQGMIDDEKPVGTGYGE